MFVRGFFSFVLSLLLTVYLTPLFAQVARRLGVVDNPDGVLKRHTQSTPYLGGVALYIGFFCSLALTVPFENHIFLFMVGATLLLFVGLIDDLVVLAPHQKLFGQIFAALCFLKAGIYLKETIFYSWFNIGISLLWFVSIINAMNLIDIMDGLAGVVASCVTINLMVFAYLIGNSTTFLLLASFLGAVIGFLWYNRPAAQIYLGDAGSLFVGGFLASAPLLLNWRYFSEQAFLVPGILLAIPLLELVGLIGIRLYKNIPVYLGSPDHFALYLRRKGWSIINILRYVAWLSIALLILALLVAYQVISLFSLWLLLLSLTSLWFFLYI